MNNVQRKTWSENHKRFREILTKPEEHKEAIQLCLTLHSFLHSTSVSNSTEGTLADEIVSNLDEKTWRQYPVTMPNTRNSIAWHLWHITRIEDMTMNLLVADDQQVLHSSNWLEKMKISYTHSGNDMSEEEIAVLSSKIDFHSLLEYREEVGKGTQEIISSLRPEQWKMKVEKHKIKRLFEEKAVMERSTWLAEYWSKKDIAGLLLMPATRHIFLHLNKCERIKEKLHRNLKQIG
ncbi:DinB family protein [Bacillus alkalicellulosilyticus]|uniref:DinB family protein n=1 Tax=Alkalihalobacterium alkalicellulosilyticum TaxID=1912214 RepID=UPI00099713FA|nr:DinB family protein [Bacillus alkalicellulosilyticus]